MSQFGLNIPLRAAIFLVINFAALGLGGLFTRSGVPSEWYQDLDKAPWAPPGWVFGAAWTLIMLCFSVYRAQGLTSYKAMAFLLLLFTRFNPL